MTRERQKSVVIMMGETLISGFMTRADLEAAADHIGTALRELDLEEGRASVPDEEGLDPLGVPVKVRIAE